MAPLKENGVLYGLPLAFKSVALFYRRDLLARPPETTDELIALGRAARKHGRFALVYEAGSMSYHAAWLHGFGGALLDASGRPALDSPASVRALGFRQAALRREAPSRRDLQRRCAQLFNDGQAVDDHQRAVVRRRDRAGGAVFAWRRCRW